LGGFILEVDVDIHIYSDESGVLDNKHQNYYVFGGLAFYTENARELATRQYLSAEKTIRLRNHMAESQELKASILQPQDKRSLFQALSNYQKFSIVINQKELYPRIFNSKKDKQRYLDFAYKIMIRRFLDDQIKKGYFCANDVKTLHFYVDEHTTATNGRYELREALERELIFGTINFDFNSFTHPLFPHLQTDDNKILKETLELLFRNSAKNTLIRAADIVANRVFFEARKGRCAELIGKNKNMFVTYHPKNPPSS
jgi:hypothetical protein